MGGCYHSTNYASTLGVYDIRCPIATGVDTCSKLPATFALFPVLSCRHAHAQLSSLYPLSTFTTSHVRKNTRLFVPAQLQCSHSGAWEPGNEANTRLFMPAQLQCSRSGAWEPGNEANTRLFMPAQLQCSRSWVWEPENEANIYLSCANEISDPRSSLSRTSVKSVADSWVDPIRGTPI